MKIKILMGAVVLTFLVFGGVLAYSSYNAKSRAEQVSKDWDALSKAMNALAIDVCGGFLPSDTSWRSQDRPTFETIGMVNPYAPKGPGGWRHTWTLTTPVPYIEKCPEDPFNPGKGYGFVAWSFFDGEPRTALLHSPGPDGDMDVRIERLFMILDAPSDPKDARAGADSTGKELFRLNEDILPRYRALVGLFAYDPTNGLTSNGDMIRLYNQYATNKSVVFSTNALASEKITALLEKYPPDVLIPIPRWRDKGNEGVAFSLEQLYFPVRADFYDHFRKYLVLDKDVSGDPLDSLSNKMGAFGDFFAEIKPLTEEQNRSLDEWKAENPAWWTLIENIPYRKPDIPYVYMDFARYAQFYVFYGKSSVLQSARLFAQGELRRAHRIACGLESEIPSIHRPTYAPPLAKRAGSEIERMGRQMRAMVEKKAKDDGVDPGSLLKEN